MLILQICPCIVEQSNNNSKRSVARQEGMDTGKTVDSIFDQGDTGNPTSSPKKTSKSIFGKVVLGVTGAVAIGLVAVTTPFITPALRKICLPYVPATERQIVNVLQMCRPPCGRASQSSLSLVDLGSGDGRVVIAAAKKGYNAHGIELNPWLVWYSKLQAKWHGVSHLATFLRQDLWKVDLNGYGNVVIFGVSEMMDQLQVKVEQEVDSDSHVIACRFPFTWTPKDFIQDGIDSVWLYKKPFLPRQNSQ